MLPFVFSDDFQVKDVLPKHKLLIPIWVQSMLSTSVEEWKKWNTAQFTLG